MSTTRPWVDAFANEMEKKLALNRHKGDREGWRKMEPRELFDMLLHEVAELSEALGTQEYGRPIASYNEPLRSALAADRIEQIRFECADVGNLAMMIADVAGGLVAGNEGGKT
jgi:NTP pyrophosphatase (non-canonical NTP hydrolase)